eukprot:scaffold114838_cov49-Phaeocystis_antarctica.AAC.1
MSALGAPTLRPPAGGAGAPFSHWNVLSCECRVSSVYLTPYSAKRSLLRRGQTKVAKGLKTDVNCSRFLLVVQNFEKS